MTADPSFTHPGPALQRAGYVAILGRPNAGKSTLLNALVGERLSIVTPRPQTTWRRVAGILTEDDAQIVFIDTPGLLEAGSLLHRALVEEARRAARDADVVLLLLDPTGPIGEAERVRMTEVARSVAGPVVPAVNKIDRAEPADVEREAGWAQSTFGVPAARLSALTGEGTDALLEELRARLPEGPFLFPEDELATAPVRFFVEELVRETAFELFHEEIPYALFCSVEEFREGGDPIYIQVNVFVERSSQKGILIGRKGEAIRELGRVARRKIEHFLGARVYLDLWIKVLPRWRKKRTHLRRLGLPVPDDDAKNS